MKWKGKIKDLLNLKKTPNRNKNEKKTEEEIQQFTKIMVVDNDK